MPIGHTVMDNLMQSMRLLSEEVLIPKHVLQSHVQMQTGGLRRTGAGQVFSAITV